MLVSRNIEELVPYQPGKPSKEVERELGISDIVKLASNENPWGPSPRATAAVQAMLAEAHRYPEGGCYYLKQDLAAQLGVPQDWLVFGNGSNELIELIIRTFVLPGEEILYFDPSFAVYPIIARAADRDFRAVPLRPESFEMHPDDMIAAMGPDTKALFLTTPNNPVGNYIPFDAIARILDAADPQTLVVIDEAYIEYAEAPDCRTAQELIAANPNLIILRTFSKAYGLSGYRIGYSISQTQIADYLNRVRQPFNVNLLAQTAAQAAIQDDEHLQRSLKGNRQGREQILQGIAPLGVEHVPTQANFMLVHCLGDGGAVFQDMLRQGVTVRHIPHPMIANYVRVTIGTPQENQRFLEAFANSLRNLGRIAS